MFRAAAISALALLIAAPASAQVPQGAMGDVAARILAAHN
jgi:hypothetical protein